MVFYILRNGDDFVPHAEHDVRHGVCGKLLGVAVDRYRHGDISAGYINDDVRPGLRPT